MHLVSGSDGRSGPDAAEGGADVVASVDAGLASSAPDVRIADEPVLADASAILVETPTEVAQVLRRGTNYGSLTVVVYSDASAVRTMVGSVWNDGASDASTVTTLPLGSPELVKFLQDLAAVDDVSAIQGPPTCPGDSVSFGTRTYLTVGEKTGGNLQCPDNPTPAQAALAADCVTLTQ